MNKKEVAEIKRRLKKENCTIQHMCGCYVDAEKNSIAGAIRLMPESLRPNRSEIIS